MPDSGQQAAAVLGGGELGQLGGGVQVLSGQGPAHRRHADASGGSHGGGGGPGGEAVEERRAVDGDEKRKELITDASHVRSAIARSDQVQDARDADRELAFANFKKVAAHHEVEMAAERWQDLGKPESRLSGSRRSGAFGRAWKAEPLMLLQQVVEEQCRTGRVPGAVALVATADGVDVACAGVQTIDGEPMTWDSLFRIASITKPMLAAAAMVVVERGHPGAR